MMGQCKLCLKLTSLKKSHLLPASIYRRLRNENEKNPNPFVLSSKKAVQTSKQKWAHLLCQDCEQRLNKYGEYWVLGNCVQEDGSFPLASILASRKPDMYESNNPTMIYNASNIPEINVSALSYFAASIFWRGSIYAWKDDGSIPVELGPFYEEFRQYLLGLKYFPKHCSLLVYVRKGEEIDHWMTYGQPVGGRQGNFHLYKFAMTGLAFMLITSRNNPAIFRKTCFVHRSGNPIIVTTLIDKLLQEESHRLFKNHSSAKSG